MAKAHHIVFANEKGGTGKSTTAVHVAIALASRGARVAFTHIDFMDQNRDAGTRNLNATRIGLGLGVEGSITRPQDLRLEGRINRAVGKSNGGGSAVMASWNMRF